MEWTTNKFNKYTERLGFNRIIIYAEGMIVLIQGQTVIAMYFRSRARISITDEKR